MQMALRQTFLFTETYVQRKPEVLVARRRQVDRDYVLRKPEILLARAQDKFDAEGRLTDEKTREFVGKLLAALVPSGAEVPTSLAVTAGVEPSAARRG